jgi:hypothetical protein
VFREKIRPPAPIAEPPLRRESAPADEEGKKLPSAPKSGAQGSGESLERSQRDADDMAATGIGRQIDHRVRRVRFETEESPAALMEIRYEYRAALVKLGVLPRPYAYHEDPLERRERARGFDEPGFAPDPYRGR